MSKVIGWTVAILLIVFGFTTNKYLGAAFFVIAVILAFAQEKIKNQQEKLDKYNEKQKMEEKENEKNK